MPSIITKDSSGKLRLGISRGFFLFFLTGLFLSACQPSPTPAPGQDVDALVNTRVQQTQVMQTRAAAVEPSPQPSTPTIGGPEDFYGPLDGELVHRLDKPTWFEMPDLITSDFEMTVDFYNPADSADAAWDYGIAFRGDTGKWMFLIFYSDTSWWLYCGESSELTAVQGDTLAGMNTGDREPNFIRLTASGSTGELFVNDDWIADLDLSCTSGAGAVALASGWHDPDRIEGGVTGFSNFTVQTRGGAGLPPPEPESTPTPTRTAGSPEEGQRANANANIVWEESGSLNTQNRDADKATNDVWAGVTENNGVAQAFLSFTIDHISDDATVTKVIPFLANYRVKGDPFSLGPLYLFWYPYGNLGDLNFAEDFQGIMDPATALAEWDSYDLLESHIEIPAMVPLVQEALRNGATRIQVRLQFAPDAIGMNADALLIFLKEEGNPNFNIHFTLPD